MSFISHLLSPINFMPHGHCYLWKPSLLFLHNVSDGLITLAYYSIPLTLIYFVRKRKDIPFSWIFILFGAFISGCGTTHLMEIVTTWVPAYWVSGLVKFATALISLITAVLLIRLIPKALALPTTEQLEEKNQELYELTVSLEERVNERTAAAEQKAKELEKTNLELEQFNRVAIGREERMIELKRQVNELSQKLGRAAPYNLSSLS